MAVLVTSLFGRGLKSYELSNHLGNVLTTITDRKYGFDTNSDDSADYYIADVANAQDYYPFGMLSRQIEGDAYRYGFNGKENDREVKGDGAQYDYGFRIYDARIGRFFSVDPLTADYAYYSPYQYAGDMPILTADIDGLEGEIDPNLSQIPLTQKDLPMVFVTEQKKVTGWDKFKAFGKGVIRGVVTTVAVVVAVSAVVATAGAAGPFIIAGVAAYSAYEMGKTGYEIISGKEAYTGRKLKTKERYEKAGELTGGLLVGGGLAVKGVKAGKLTEGVVESPPVETIASRKSSNSNPEQYSEFIDTPENLPVADYVEVSLKSITDGIVNKKHHNWNVIFGDKKPSVSDVMPYVEKAIEKGTWVLDRDAVSHKKTGSRPKYNLVGEVDGHKIWVQGTKDPKTGKIDVTGAGVETTKH